MSWKRFEIERPELDSSIFALNATQLWWGNYNPSKSEENTPPFVPIFWIVRPIFTEEEIAFSTIKPVLSEEKKVEDGSQNEKISRETSQESGVSSKKSRKKQCKAC